MQNNHFEQIVSEHYEGLYRFAFSLARQESDAWDLTQQTFYVWATKGDQLRDRSKVKTWLFTTLHRAFLTGRRKNNRFRHEELEAIANELPAESPDPVSENDCGEVVRALGLVDQLYQPAVALFYLGDYPYKDIAEILGVPVGTVKSRIARGVAQLRKIFLSDSGTLDCGEKERDLSPALHEELAGDF